MRLAGGTAADMAAEPLVMGKVAYLQRQERTVGLGQGRNRDTRA